MRQIPLLTALALAASLTQAQTVFRSEMPDGRVIYGDQPAPGAKDVKQITLPPPNISATPQPPAPASKPAPNSASVPAPAATKSAVEIADAQVTRAEEELRAARAALEAGRIEREGDRVGMVGGRARLSETYFERIKSLEADVAAAQKKLDDAYDTRRYAH
jgi:uncharacterized protein DUF4124